MIESEREWQCVHERERVCVCDRERERERVRQRRFGVGQADRDRAGIVCMVKGLGEVERNTSEYGWVCVAQNIFLVA